MRGSNRPLLAFFGHHKCATSWIHLILSEASRLAGLKHAYLDNPRQFGGDLNGFVRDGSLDVVSYVNADRRYVSSLPGLRAFHVVRDPRDLIVSAYFSHLHSHPTHDWPELEPHRERLRSASKADGLLLELEFSAEVLERIAEWDYEQPHVMELKQEELTGSPYDTFLEVFDFLGLLDSRDYRKHDRIRTELRIAWNSVAARSALLPSRRTAKLPGERLLGIVYGCRFSSLAGGRDRGAEEEQSHYRKGVPGDWRNHFDPRLRGVFKDRYNDLLVKLGYETAGDW